MKYQTIISAVKSDIIDVRNAVHDGLIGFPGESNEQYILTDRSLLEHLDKQISYAKQVPEQKRMTVRFDGKMDEVAEFVNVAECMGISFTRRTERIWWSSNS